MGYLPIQEDEKVAETSKHSRISTDVDEVSSPEWSPLRRVLMTCFALAYIPFWVVLGMFMAKAVVVVDPSMTPSCADAAPIPAAHFYDRQRSLATALHHLNASAFIVEPGPTAQYYFNVSTTNWKLSERPLLFFLSPEVLDDGVIVPKITVLAPKFERTRASLLPMPQIGRAHV